MTAWRGTSVAIALGLVLVGTHASAQSAATSGVAEKLFREGKVLAADARYDEAIEKFRASQELEPSVGVLLSLGDCYRAQSKVASAWSAYVSARDLAKTRGDARVADAQARADAVAPRVPHLTVRLAEPANATVTDNGMTLPAGSLGSSLPVDPGAHAIVVAAKGKKPFRATESLAEGGSAEVNVPALAIDDTPDPAATSERTAENQRKLGTGLLVGGGVVTAAGLVFGGLALSKWSTVTSACPGKQCDTSAQRDQAVEDAKTAQSFATVSTATIVVGLAAVGAGLVLHLTASPSRTTAWTATVGAQRVAIGATFP